jgi:hypothetical protein
LQVLDAVDSDVAEVALWSKPDAKRILACSPISDPSVMRVSEALRGKERLDDDLTTDAE